MSKKLIFLASFALLLCATADVQADLTEVLNPSFEDDWTGWYHRTSYTWVRVDGDNNFVELGNGSWFYQQIGTWEEEMQLQVSFLVGKKPSKNLQGLYISLWVGGDPSLAANSGTKTPTTLESAVGATQIVISDLIAPLLADGETSEQVLELSTGTGYTYGEPLWLLVQAEAAGQRTLIDSIIAVRQGDWEPYPYAMNPDPAEEALIEDTWVELTWSPSRIAVSHNVYFSESFDDVNDGTNDAFINKQTEPKAILGLTDYPYPEGLVPGTTYYWRIDEVNDAEPNSPWKGDIWSFTIPPRNAYDISPLDGTKFVDPNVELIWTGGLGAILHHVYFGDNFDDVNDGAADTYKGALTDPTYLPPGTLELDKTYYWRVDEFDNTSTLKGDVWSFTIEPFIPITDPNLVCWWGLEEASGRRVLDLSGHGHHGDFQGNPEWIDGYDGYGLHFANEGDYVVHSLNAASDWPAGTMAVWVKADSVGQDVWSSVFSSHIPNSAGFQIDTNGGNPGVYQITGGFIFGDVSTRWIHLALTFEGTSAKLYYNGYWTASGTLNDTTFNQFALCTNRNVGNSLFGILDDFRIYDKVLTQEEVQLVMRIDPLLAWDPSPGNGATPDIENVTPLTWLAGDNASQHDVYFGTDKDVVADADTSTADIYRGRRNTTSYTPPEGVEWGVGPYYWRVDENNTDGTVTKGRVWSFTVADFILVDDFETYDANDNQIWWAWKDGLGYVAHDTEPAYLGNETGSAVGDDFSSSYTEETIVNGGNQSMPFWYNNNKQDFAKYSEAEMILIDPRDWSKYRVTGANTISESFHCGSEAIRHLSAAS